MVFFHSGGSIQCIEHGVPDSWSKIKTWLDHSQPIFAAHPLPEPSFLLKCFEITELDRYDIPPHIHFGIISQKILQKHHPPQKLTLMNLAISFPVANTNGLLGKQI